LQKDPGGGFKIERGKGESLKKRIRKLTNWNDTGLDIST